MNHLNDDRSEVSTGSDWSWPTVHADKTGDTSDETTDNTDNTDNTDDKHETDQPASAGLLVTEDRSRRISKLPPAEVSS